MNDRLAFYIGVLMGTWFTQWIAHGTVTPWGAAWTMTRITLTVLACRAVAGWAFDRCAGRKPQEGEA